MAGIFNGPPRGGTRGGRSEFSWDNVKADQSREYYLGHSVKAVTGRWAKGKDVIWYTRDKEEGGESADARREHEMAMVKQREQDLMMEALGMKPKAPKHETRQARLDQEDMKKLLGRNQDEDYQNQEAGPSGEGDRIRGLGYNASRTTGAVQSGVEQERLDGMGMRSVDMLPPSNRDTTAAAPPPPSRAVKTYEQEKEDKKAANRAKKESRKEKKRSSSSRKDSKRDEKRRKRRSQRSRSRSRSRELSSPSPSPERNRGRDRTEIGKETIPAGGDDTRREHRKDRKHLESRRRSRSRSPQCRRRDSRSRSRERSRERRRY